MRYNIFMTAYKRRSKHSNKHSKEKEEKKYQFFGSRLQQIMLIRDIQNFELAEALFVTPSTISGYRTGRRSPDVEQLSLIAQKLEVSADYLLGLCDDTSVPIRPFPYKGPDIDWDDF